jgi:hypothetical protein
VPHVRLSKTYAFGIEKLKKIKNKNCNSYGLMKILTIQKSLTIKPLRLLKKIFFTTNK